MEGHASRLTRRWIFSAVGTLAICAVLVGSFVPKALGEKPEDPEGESARLVLIKCAATGGPDHCGVAEALLKFPSHLADQLTIADLQLQLQHLLAPAPARPGAAIDSVRVSRWRLAPLASHGETAVPVIAVPSDTPLREVAGETLLVFRGHGDETGTREEYKKLNEISFDTDVLGAFSKTGGPGGVPTIWLSAEGEVRPVLAAGLQSSLSHSQEVHLVLSALEGAARFPVKPQVFPMKGGRREEGEGESGYFVYLPTADQLSRIFPSMYYFPVRLREKWPEFLVDIEQMHEFPTSLSTYKCSNTDFHIFTAQGLADLTTALSRPLLRRKNKVFRPFAAALAARRPWYIEREQDPTVVLHQWWREENSENGEEVWTETPLLWVFPDLGEVAVSEAAAAGVIPRWGDDLHRTAKMVRGFVATSFSKILIGRLKKSYNIDREESNSMKDVDPSHSASEYASLQDFFTRPINVEVLRPWNYEALVVAPADAVVQNIFSIKPDADGYIRHQTVPQVKSTTFHLRKFLLGDEKKQNEIKLQSPRHRLYLSIHYLSPRDYHRFHSPADWRIEKQIYIPGCTPSVNRESLENREGILHHFERTSLIGSWDPLNTGEKLFYSVILVAARFVGGLSLAWEAEPLHPRGGPKACGPEAANYIEEKAVDIPMCMGQELGAFRFGSTVAVIFEGPEDLDITSLGECSHALVGQTLAALPGYPRQTLERCNAFFANYRSPSEYLAALKEHPEYDERLRQNSLVRADWRSEEGRVAAEKVRAIERGLGTRYAVARFLFSQWNPEHSQARIIVGQPAALARAGGQDKVGHYVPKCFSGKKSILLEFQGRVSVLKLEVPVNGKEILLFKSPFKGCVGDEKLGKDTRGIAARWRLSPTGEEIHVGLRVESGTFASETPQLFLFAGLLQLKGTCETAWMSGSRAGPTSAVCGSVSAVRKSEEVQEVVTLSNTDLATTNIYATAA